MSKIILVLLRLLEAWVDLANAFVSVITFAICWPGWDMKIRCWTSKIALKYRKGKGNDKS